MSELYPAARNILKHGGVFVPSPLALDENLRMMEQQQRLLTLYYIRSGACAVIPGAHTGEFANGDLELYDRWLQIIRDMTAQYGAGNMLLMAAVGGQDARKMAEQAAENGYDLVMIAPTAFSGLSEDEVVELFRDIATIIPTFGFELQRAIPGAYPFTPNLWRQLFDIVCGAKGASFDTYRSLTMLESAAASKRRDELVLLTGNDDRIVADLAGVYGFPGGSVRYSGGLLGHTATDTHAAIRWMTQVMKHRDGDDWDFPLSYNALAHAVNRCNMALFDAANNFANSVWGVKKRLTDLGLMPAPRCFHETGSHTLSDDIAQVYGEYPDITDDVFVQENLDDWKRETGTT
jgi:dihydrodipicolinate synthase/N-acetylneuraminate lyase